MKTPHHELLPPLNCGEKRFRNLHISRRCSSSKGLKWRADNNKKPYNFQAFPEQLHLSGHLPLRAPLRARPLPPALPLGPTVLAGGEVRQGRLHQDLLLRRPLPGGGVLREGQG